MWKANPLILVSNYIHSEQHQNMKSNEKKLNQLFKG